MLKKLYAPELELINASESMDTKSMQQALEEKNQIVNVGHAGTAMRFATAFWATQEGKTVELRGSDRMHERPIGVLVDALRSLGADIQYLQKEGYPPLLIKGKRLQGKQVFIEGGVSSQFISALMLIGPALKGGLEVEVKGFSVSAPYIYMTRDIMRKLDLDVEIKGSQISLKPFQAEASIKKPFRIEPDWSSASYWYAFAALAKTSKIYLPFLREKSMQGDAAVQGFFEAMGVSSVYLGSGYRIQKEAFEPQELKLDLNATPDLAQTLAVTAAALQVPLELSGLQTLRIKETDRLEALKTELEKAGAKLQLGSDSLKVVSGIRSVEGIRFETYDDHRMAMAFAPLALLGEIEISHPSVVDKSYPYFWQDLKGLGFITEFSGEVV